MPERSLPEVLPIFPLTGVLLLPGMWLPLNIFEPRYRNLVRDALESARYIGMVQPVVPRQDNSPPPDAPPENPPVYPVGCAGWIEQCEATPDGRYQLTLKGISRFRVREELPLHEGYRRVRADYTGYEADLAEPEAALNPAPLLEALERFGKANQIPFDLKRLETVSGISLLNGLSMSLPFAPAEKQALLEAPQTGQRERMLLTLMGMGLKDKQSEEEPHTPPTLN